MVRVPKGKNDEPLEVIWNDATADNNWKSEHSDICSIMSIGYLAHQDKKQVCLSASVSDSNNRSSQIAIPRGCIVSMKRFRRKSR